ncbi:hypothetical protein F511_21830 [Dorcoceras hygrometricum]|uniref:Uncharacterized protein n=1 Tax=Dorcoceras hygrometricum TaxID=472368 RepID=A0A2Z7BZ05_9LAMI|nr:hypothetical protein F511_21830 [Dorcoceras hygrometricum]
MYQVISLWTAHGPRVSEPMESLKLLSNSVIHVPLSFSGSCGDAGYGGRRRRGGYPWLLRPLSSSVLRTSNKTSENILETSLQFLACFFAVVEILQRHTDRFLDGLIISSIFCFLRLEKGFFVVERNM